mmetsp:Transcript_61957/g.110396  ORF Transcript_61957/g.110396 Transcript_61957/m.110396 type:complete len:85 (+) Transcript_61957:212-466(+)
MYAVCRQLQKSNEVMAIYAEYTGQEMNVDASKLVMQGKWNMGIVPSRLEGFEVVTSVRYLKIQLGRLTIKEQWRIEEQYGGEDR